MSISQKLRLRCMASTALGLVFLSVLAGKTAHAACPNPVPDNESCIIADGEKLYGTLQIGSSAHVTNKGTISTEGFNANAVHTYGNSTIINEGKIEAKGDIADGIEAGGDNVTIINKGQITTSGNTWDNGADGIDASGRHLTVNNTGTIKTDSPYSHGIRVRNDDATITNSGTISTSGYEATGISGERRIVIINTGTITASGERGDPVRAGSESQITNTGTIYSAKGRALTFHGFGGGVKIVNSGRIFGGGDAAIAFSGINNTLVLEPGSRLQGLVMVGTSSTIHINTGMTTVLTVDNIKNATFISSMPLIYDKANNRVIALSSSGIDLASTLAPVAAGQIARAANAAMGAGGMRIQPVSGSSASVADMPGSGLVAFLTGIGGIGTLPGKGVTDNVEHRLGGGLAGLQWRGENLIVGLFAGGGHGRSMAESGESDSAARMKSDLFFGGIQAGWHSGALHLSGVFSGGIMKNHTRRTILDNMAPGGMAQVRGKYDSLFLSGHVGIGWDIATFNNGFVLQPGLSARLTWARNEAYRESGSVAAYDVGKHTSLSWGGRAQLALYKTMELESGLLQISSRIGVDFSRFDKDAPSARIGDMSVPLTASVKRNVIAGFAGIGAALSLSQNSHLMLDMEATFGGKDAAGLSGRIGYAINF
ncbi:autotransporter outer membrane beta-barrel domain-containing protein [Thermopetrobacter sp. TC1]|uniref:autotransporter outer membrane beta-barrel domain-containing protein n=1 Tax=Thermopetrobacter sp. TC1 TaxID=1495045 RepID=UPI000570BD9C|nr:autotransporter outer membrane beta-barrel domain-containing protein [Thermopetrobacter sp. TC1]